MIMNDIQYPTHTRTQKPAFDLPNPTSNGGGLRLYHRFSLRVISKLKRAFARVHFNATRPSNGGGLRLYHRFSLRVISKLKRAFARVHFNATRPSNGGGLRFFIGRAADTE